MSETSKGQDADRVWDCGRQGRRGSEGQRRVHGRYTSLVWVRLIPRRWRRELPRKPAPMITILRVEELLPDTVEASCRLIIVSKSSCAVE